VNRRGFLKMLGAASVAAASGIAIIDTAKTFFLPPIGGWRQGNSFSLDDFEERIIRPAVQAIAHQVDAEMYRIISDLPPERVDIQYSHALSQKFYRIPLTGMELFHA
jgi:hypothetical protein